MPFVFYVPESNMICGMMRIVTALTMETYLLRDGIRCVFC